ncbi:coniferyl aldehyde dehydrogenase [Marinobacter bryozoorum]|uniref:coniferyl aldehyde dehydrogenase n=1 Tax=Marinobacter bryozoorum TaxID=256324 RepID=UPI002006A7A3|nr:coniferyl aldehyde dehydrogenase [Marinobacter bryozoorum]MCK7542687.1 coniferyl aldehyde dehydrogenase [Marinobacter bryozoorum]
MTATVVPLNESKQQIQLTARVMAEQKQAFTRNPLPTASERLDNLQRLKKALLAHQEQFCEAIDRDFNGRSRDETLIAEVIPSVEGINYAMKNLKGWMQPERRSVSMLFQPASNKVYYQPKGVVGIIVPWNYPLYLAIGPLVAALAAGNRAMIKMSEFTPHTSALLANLVEATFPRDLVAVINGEADVAADFSARPFDHLLFTGSTTVGRLVMKAASENLTPVTLELGGKSPAIVSSDVPVEDAAERIAFGKALNAGQTCVAPDYVLCPSDRINAFVDAFQDAMARMYPTLRDNSDYTAIINDRQYQRLQEYLADARSKGAQVIEVNPAGEHFEEGCRKMPVTLLLNPTEDMKVTQDEIFGPLLPVVASKGLEDAMTFINSRPRPLALYYFGYGRDEQKRLLAGTHSGGVCINDALMHVAQDDLPFGGIGDSGMGHYHGKEGFLTFSHARAVFSKQKINSGKLVYPPYGGALHKLVYRFFIR